jgi:hypothetical protein
MGTNYYALTNVCICCDRPEETIHIGKRSGGWRFVFHGTEEIRSWEDWRTFLRKPGTLIKEKYGPHLTLSELIEIVDESRPGKTEMFYPGQSTEWEDPEGFRFWDVEFS